MYEFASSISRHSQGSRLEDIPFCAGVQRGLGSASYQPGPLSHLEKANWRFHRFLQERLQKS